MTLSESVVCGAVIVAILVVLVMGRGLGWLKFSLFGKTGISAGKAKPSPGAFAEDATSKKNLRVRNEGPGTASANRSTAQEGDIDVSNINVPKKG
jgi:hypothetical protein